MYIDSALEYPSWKDATFAKHSMLLFVIDSAVVFHVIFRYSATLFAVSWVSPYFSVLFTHLSITVVMCASVPCESVHYRSIINVIL